MKNRFGLVLTFLVAAFVSLLILGCETQQPKKSDAAVSKEGPGLNADLPDDEVKVEFGRNIPTPKLELPTPPKITADTDYTIGQGDKIQVTVWRQPDLSGEYLVDGRGKVVMPLVNEVKVEGHTTYGAIQVIKEAYKTYLKSPEITVKITEYQSKKITVTGELADIAPARKTMKVVTLKGPTRVMDVVADSGGFSSRANTKALVLTRDKKLYHINANSYLLNHDEDQNVLLKDGDILQVEKRPKSDQMRVLTMGEVKASSVITFEETLRLSEAIVKSGGFTEDAKLRHITVIRVKGGNETEVLTPNFKAFLKKGDRTQDIELKDGDIVYFTKSPMGNVGLFLKRIAPILSTLAITKGLSETTFKSNGQ